MCKRLLLPKEQHKRKEMSAEQIKETSNANDNNDEYKYTTYIIKLSIYVIVPSYFI